MYLFVTPTSTSVSAFAGVPLCRQHHPKKLNYFFSTLKLKRSSSFASTPFRYHDVRGSDLHLCREVHYVVVLHSEAARGHGLPDGPGLVRAVDTVERRAEIDRARAERLSDAAGSRSADPAVASAFPARRPSGHSRFCETIFMPDQVKPSRPTPIP